MEIHAAEALDERARRRLTRSGGPARRASSGTTPSHEAPSHDTTPSHESMSPAP